MSNFRNLRKMSMLLGSALLLTFSIPSFSAEEEKIMSVTLTLEMQQSEAEPILNLLGSVGGYNPTGGQRVPEDISKADCRSRGCVIGVSKRTGAWCVCDDNVKDREKVSDY